MSVRVPLEKQENDIFTEKQKLKKIIGRKANTVILKAKKTESRRKVRSKIFKEKGYKKTVVVNKVTGRRNQLLHCLTCKQKLKKQCNFKDHLLLHLGLRPYDCVLCGRNFT